MVCSTICLSIYLDWTHILTCISAYIIICLCIVYSLSNNNCRKKYQRKINHNFFLTDFISFTYENTI